MFEKLFKNLKKSFEFSESSNNKKMDLTTENIQKILGSSSDVKIRELLINEKTKLEISMVYVDGLANQSFISDYILKPLFNDVSLKNAENTKRLIKLIDEGNIYFSSQIKSLDINQTIDEVLSGGTALIFDDCKTSFIFDTKGFEKRAITEPTVENITKGSKDSFVETFRMNTATIRRKIKTPNLVVENLVIGKQTLTSVAIIYIKNLTNTNLIDEVRKRLNAINIDSVLTSGAIEEFICDDVNSVFPQLMNTERPDKFCSDIVEGRVGIIVDGIPIGFIAPGTFVQFLQAPEDYSRNYIISSLIRVLRYSVFAISIFLPAFFIALTTFHQEMLPTQLALSIAKTHTDVAFPMIIEVLFMLLSFEILFEASLRIPKTIGQAISIVGTLVIGQAAVDAKLVSPVTVIIIAVVSISAFVTPNQDLSNGLRVWRFIFTALAGFLGLFGVVLGLIMFIYHLSKLESFGIPYLSPIVSGDEQKLIEDTLFRFPLKFNKTRPKNLNASNNKRQGD